MKIRELIETLLSVHTLEDEIIVEWISKESLTDWLDSGEYDHTEKEFDSAWLAIQDKGQIEFSETISNSGIIYDIRDLVLDEIVEMRENRVKVE